MKKVILSLLLLTGLDLVAHAGIFKISGVVEIPEGEMVLYVDRVTGRDTIARAPLVNGKFSMQGTIERPEYAIIGVKGYEGGFPFFLDDEKPYHMTLKNQDGSHIVGGKLHAAYVEYLTVVAEVNTGIRDLEDKINEAREARHFRTVSLLNKQLEQIRMDGQQRVEALLQKNRGNLVATYILCNKAEQSGNVQQMQAVYESLTASEKETELANLLAKRIADLESLTVGQTAPEFVLPDKDGKEVRLSGLKGKIKLIDFWASWCGPCRLENPNMVSLYKDFKDKGLVIVSVSLDTDKTKWLAAIRKDGLPWIHVSSLKGWECEVVKRYKVDAVPYIWVLDENGKILTKQIRGTALRAFLSEYLTGKQL